MTPTTIDSLFQAAVNLSPDDRVELAERLLATIDNHENMNAWAQEAERRIEKLDSGEMKEISLEDALASLKRRLRQ